MIEEIKINGILYKLIENPKKVISCYGCDLQELCEETDFLSVCTFINGDDYIYEKQ